MSKYLFNIVGESLQLPETVTLATIQAKADLFIKDLKEMGKRCDEITIAHALFVAGQKHWIEGGKGNTEGVQAWLIQLYMNNKNWYDSAVKFYRATLGLSFRVHRDDDDSEDAKPECSVVIFDKRNLADIKVKQALAFVKAWENGISYDETGTYAKIKLPKKVASKGGSGSVSSPSNVIEVTKGQALSEALGLDKVLGEAAESETTAQALDDVKDLIASIIEIASKHNNRSQLKDILSSTVSKLSKGLTLSAVMNKAS